MKNKSVQNCRFNHRAKFHCIMTTLNRLFKIEFERGGGNWKRALFFFNPVVQFFCLSVLLFFGFSTLKIYRVTVVILHQVLQLLLNILI